MPTICMLHIHVIGMNLQSMFILKLMHVKRVKHPIFFSTSKYTKSVLAMQSCFII